uniref:Uncharacterized protein n=1 Tax=Pipistrellus kuhlii TaxID=59472 RepID=A0A7J8B1F1_PIPKU|nr:hypothetical protein mPipKuh1_007686 [Pipistrellus kuhlii]
MYPEAMVFSGIEVYSKEIPEKESPCRDPESSGLRLFSYITGSSMESSLLLQIVSKDGTLCTLLQRDFTTTTSTDGGSISPPLEFRVALTCFDQWNMGEGMLYKLQARGLRGLEICIFTLFKALICKKQKTNKQTKTHTVRALLLEKQVEES